MFSGNPRHGEYFPADIRRGMAAVLLPSFMIGTSPANAKPGKERKDALPVATPEIAEKQADLGELRTRIEGLRKELQSMIKLIFNNHLYAVNKNYLIFGIQLNIQHGKKKMSRV